MTHSLPVRIAIALLSAVGLVWCLSGAVAASGTNALVGTPIKSVFVRLPKGGTAAGKPLQVLVALHGMGGNGEDFSHDLIDQADKFGWLIVAPTIDYGDWTKPDVVANEDPLLIRSLSDYLDALPQTAGVHVRKQVLLLGHSRGAQLAHRFAEFRPERVLAVAVLSAGTYTLPLSANAGASLSFPFGIKDLAKYSGRAFDALNFNQVRFWVGVGGNDTNPNDIPRQWDKYEGTTRVQRAQAFEAAMRARGVTTILKVFGGAQHEVTTEMRQEACSFLGKAMTQPQILPQVAPSLAARAMSY